MCASVWVENPEAKESERGGNPVKSAPSTDRDLL